MKHDQKADSLSAHKLLDKTMDNNVAAVVQAKDFKKVFYTNRRGDGGRRKSVDDGENNEEDEGVKAPPQERSKHKLGSMPRRLGDDVPKRRQVRRASEPASNNLWAAAAKPDLSPLPNTGGLKPLAT